MKIKSDAGQHSQFLQYFTFESAKLFVISDHTLVIHVHVGGRGCMQGRWFVINEDFFSQKKCKLIGYLTNHTLLRHVHVGGSPLSVMFRGVDPDIRLSMIKKEMFKCPRFKPGRPLVRFCVLCDMHSEAAHASLLIFALSVACMISDLPGWGVTQRRPFGGIGPFIYIGHKTLSLFWTASTVCQCASAVHDARAQRLRGGTTGGS